MPYVLTLWYDFNRFNLKRVTGAQAIGPIEKCVILLRLNLKEGLNKILVQLDDI